MTFCLHLLVMKPFQHGVFCQERLGFKLRLFFLLRVDPIKKGGKNDNSRVVSSKSIPTHCNPDIY